MRNLIWISLALVMSVCGAALQAAAARVRFTATRVSTDGKWLCVATQDSPLKM